MSAVFLCRNIHSWQICHRFLVPLPGLILHTRVQPGCAVRIRFRSRRGKMWAFRISLPTEIFLVNLLSKIYSFSFETGGNVSISLRTEKNCKRNWRTLCADMDDALYPCTQLTYLSKSKKSQNSQYTGTYSHSLNKQWLKEWEEIVKTIFMNIWEDYWLQVSTIPQ